MKYPMPPTVFVDVLFEKVRELTSEVAMYQGEIGATEEERQRILNAVLIFGSIRVSQRELRPFQGRDGSPATR
jgi:hypothetical protein